jgi:hypothetical protein
MEDKGDGNVPIGRHCQVLHTFNGNGSGRGRKSGQFGHHSKPPANSRIIAKVLLNDGGWGEAKNSVNLSMLPNHSHIYLFQCAHLTLHQEDLNVSF